MREVDVRVRESGQLFTRMGIKRMGCCDLIKSQALDPPVLIHISAPLTLQHSALHFAWLFLGFDGT